MGTTGGGRPMGQGGGWGGGRARRGGENGGRPPSAPSLPSLPPLSALLSSQGGGQAPLAPSRGAAGRPPPLCRCGALPIKRKTDKAKIAIGAINHSSSGNRCALVRLVARKPRRRCRAGSNRLRRRPADSKRQDKLQERP